MSVSIRGDFRLLATLRSNLAELADVEFHKQLSKLAVAAGLALLDEQFQKGIGPEGQAWAPPKKRAGKPLLDTGRLRNSFGSTGVNQYRFGIGTDVVYAGIHNSGGTITQHRGGKEQRIPIPQRQMLPEGELGPRWAGAIEEEANYLLEQTMGKP